MSFATMAAILSRGRWVTEIINRRIYLSAPRKTNIYGFVASAPGNPREDSGQMYCQGERNRVIYHVERI